MLRKDKNKQISRAIHALRISLRIPPISVHFQFLMILGLPVDAWVATAAFLLR